MKLGPTISRQNKDGTAVTEKRRDGIHLAYDKMRRLALVNVGPKVSGSQEASFF
jgi:hypothetical protein